MKKDIFFFHSLFFSFNGLCIYHCQKYFYSFKRMTACHAIHLPLFSEIPKMGDALFSYSTVCSTEKYLFRAISHFIYCI